MRISMEWNRLNCHSVENEKITKNFVRFDYSGKNFINEHYKIGSLLVNYKAPKKADLVPSMLKYFCQ